MMNAKKKSRIGLVASITAGVCLLVFVLSIVGLMNYISDVKAEHRKLRQQQMESFYGYGDSR